VPKSDAKAINPWKYSKSELNTQKALPVQKAEYAAVKVGKPFLF